MRNDKGQFAKGHTETAEQKAVRIKACQQSWKDREDYTNGLAGTKFHNSWRAFRFTLKGKKAGCSEEWRTFNNFVSDMYPSYVDGYVLARRDRSLPFTKQNCYWIDRSLLRSTSEQITIAYNGEELSLKEWSVKLDISLPGLQQRYHKGHGYSNEEILFGKKHRKRRWKAEDEIKTRASKLLSSYRLKDSKRGFENDIEKSWFVDNILLKPCHYCGGRNRIGADRINNSLGHLKSNVVPCCYECNWIRADKFSSDEMKLIGDVLKRIYRERDETDRSS